MKISRWVPGFMALVIFGAMSPVAFAQGFEDEAQEAKTLINIDVTDVPITEVLRYIATEAGVNIIPMPIELSGDVTIRIVREHWREVLNIVAERADCTVRQETARTFIVERPPRITMEFVDAEIKVVLDLIARNAGSNIVISQDVQGLVSLNLRNVPWRTALDTIVKTANYAVVEEDRNILRIVHPDSLQAQLETRSYPLLYVRPPDTYKAIYRERGPGLSGAAVPAAGTSGTFVLGNPKAVEDPIEDFSLREALLSAITGGGASPKPGRNLQYSIETNTFFATGTRTELQEIERIIAEIDVAPLQVHVDVKFIITESSHLIEQGIRWNDPSTVEEDGFISRLVFGTTQVGNSIANPFNGIVTPAGNPGVGTQLGQFPFAFGDGTRRFASTFNIPALLDLTDSLATLRLVDADISSRITQAPSLTMLDHAEATIFVGENVPFAEQRATVDQNGNVTVTLEESDGSPISIGFVLFLTPHIVRGTDDILMTIIPRTNMLTGTTAAAVGGVEGFERFQFTVGAGGIQSFIDLPRTRDQTVVTKMMVRDSMTAVIGGLLTESRHEIVSKVPILSSIPILGSLFTFKRTDIGVDNMFIFIKPTILRTPEDVRERYRVDQNRFRSWDPFFQKAKHLKNWEPAGFMNTDKIVELEGVEATSSEAEGDDGSAEEGMADESVGEDDGDDDTENGDAVRPPPRRPAERRSTRRPSGGGN
ncbi:MAG: hypothetical protein O6952_09220 [Planctomycetota bacterium]|nr:hypothetical protein [Planctomycetota bacterium]